jgi:hypothetical protein
LTKLNIIFGMLKQNIRANFQRIIAFITQKIVTMLSKIWVWDPGSEIRKKPIPDPGVKKAPDPGSGTLDFFSRLDPDPHYECGSRSRWAKMTHNK